MLAALLCRLRLFSALRGSDGDAHAASGDYSAAQVARDPDSWWLDESAFAGREHFDEQHAVSYTHLTLPTICSV